VWPPGAAAQGLGSMVGTPRGPRMQQSVLGHCKVNCASLLSRDLSGQRNCHPFLDNSLIRYRKQDEEDLDRSSLLNPVSLQSGAAVLLSGVRARVLSREGPLNSKPLLLHENG